MKTCIKCGSTTNPFPKIKNTCKPCIKIWKRQYQIDNAERLATQRKEYRKENIETITIKRNKKYQDDKEVILVKKKKDFKENSAEILAKQKIWYQNNSEKVKAKQRLYNSKNRAKINAYAKQHRIDNRHPDAKDGSDYNVFYVWEAVGEKWNDKQIYKGGVTSERLGHKRIKEVARDFGFEYKLLKYIVCENALELEKQWHKNNTETPILDKKCGYTEFRITNL